LPLFKQQRLKPAAGSTDTGIVAAELFQQFFVAVDDAIAALHVRFGRETAPALTASLESSASRRIRLGVSCS
jgi:hypothetical protein